MVRFVLPVYVIFIHSLFGNRPDVYGKNNLKMPINLYLTGDKVYKYFNNLVDSGKKAIETNGEKKETAGIPLLQTL